VTLSVTNVHYFGGWVGVGWVSVVSGVGVSDGTAGWSGERGRWADTHGMTSVLADHARPDAARVPIDDAVVSAGRGWTRAGAIAAVLATTSSHRAVRMSVRIGLLIAGSLIIGTAVGVTLWTGLGPGPLDVFIGAVRIHTGLPLGVAVWLVVGALATTAWTLGRRPGPGTLLAPLIMAPVMQATVTLLESVDAPGSIFARLAVHLAAIAVIGLGAGALIVSGLGAGSGELIAIAASSRTGRPEPRVRLAIESSFLVFGVVLGGPIGLGTIAVALAIGPAVAMGHRFVSRSVQLSDQAFNLPRNGLAATSVGACDES